MTEVPNFEERVLNKLDDIEKHVNSLELTLLKDYVTRCELQDIADRASQARRWAIGMIIPLLIVAVEVWFR